MHLLVSELYEKICCPCREPDHTVPGLFSPYRSRSTEEATSAVRRAETFPEGSCRQSAGWTVKTSWT